MYDVNSKHADDFINHEEILDTLAYADENKHNEALINSLIEKAKLRKGLSHREASVLLACDIEEKNQERFLWKSYRYVCAALFIKLLCQRMHLLSVSYEEQAYCKKEAYSG